VHDADTPFLISPFYEQSSGVDGKSDIGSNKVNVDALTIISRITADKRWSNIDFDDVDIGKNFHLLARSEEYSTAIFEHLKAWKIDTSDEKEVEKKIEELQWMAVLLFAAPKPEESDEPRADFVL
jgi:hypothetical protein